MNKLKRLGANIRSLRKAYGETQEQLGEALFLEKNTISSYENGTREPNKETLDKIAKHFMVSVEELLRSDLTKIEKITIDKDAFWKNIDSILPIISSETALQNECFKKAHAAHEAFYKKLRAVSMDGIDNIDACFEYYAESVEDEDAQVESAANIISLWYLMLMSIKNVPSIIKNQPAALKQVVSRDEKAKRIIENTDSAFEADAKEIMDEIDGSEGMTEWVSEMLTTIKKSAEWSDLADYYLAMQYVWNLVDNDLEWGFNQRIGVEMLNAFVSVGNYYAARYLLTSKNAVNGLSSQSVDDI